MVKPQLQFKSPFLKVSQPVWLLRLFILSEATADLDRNYLISSVTVDHYDTILFVVEKRKWYWNVRNQWSGGSKERKKWKDFK